MKKIRFENTYMPEWKDLCW